MKRGSERTAPRNSPAFTVWIKLLFLAERSKICLSIERLNFFFSQIASKEIVILDCSCIRLLVSYRGFVCE